MDFTIKTYKNLLKGLQNAGFVFNSFEQFIEKPDNKKTVVLRHDVDRLPENALKIAKIENDYGIKGSYYFRAVPESWNENVIKEIATLGHEIGYHYENMDTCNGNIDNARDNFKYNLDKLRKLTEVKTICMHGSPLSKFDNRDIWKKYNYKDYGIIAEPYFDLDFNKVFYITDASRSWNNEKVTVRDKVQSNYKFKISSTNDIIKLIKSKDAPSQIMLNIHPHNWTDNWFDWMKILIWQNFKNLGKRFLIQVRKNEK